jgi:SsrA-binding protein
MIAENRKARHEYTFLETWTAGISLTGSEVKSIKAGNLDFTGSWCELRSGECFCRELYVKESISAYSHQGKRERKLLLTKKELKKLDKMMDRGLTIVPVKIFVNSSGLIKMEIALAKGKKDWDKRHAIKERDLVRALTSEYQNK